MSLNYSDYSQVSWTIPDNIQVLLWQVANKIWIAVELTETSNDCEWFWIMTIEWNRIWEIYIWRHNAWYKTFQHIWIEVSTDYRRVWIWTKLYMIWQEFWNQLLEEEYTRQYAKIKFLEELWYIPVSLINDDTWRETEINWDELEEKIWNGYSCKLILE